MSNQAAYWVGPDTWGAQFNIKLKLDSRLCPQRCQWHRESAVIWTTTPVSGQKVPETSVLGCR